MLQSVHFRHSTKDLCLVTGRRVIGGRYQLENGGPRLRYQPLAECAPVATLDIA